jgi:hypothetical protein
MSEEVRWLSYDELAAVLGIHRESARQLAIRKRWGRRKGNDGRARVGVPEDALRPEPRPATRPETGPSPAESTSDHTSPIQVLTRHIERLEQELGMVREKAAERDTLAAQVEALKITLEMLREDRDRWHTAARQPWWGRLVG